VQPFGELAWFHSLHSSAGPNGSALEAVDRKALVEIFISDVGFRHTLIAVRSRSPATTRARIELDVNPVLLCAHGRRQIRRMAGFSPLKGPLLGENEAATFCAQLDMSPLYRPREPPMASSELFFFPLSSPKSEKKKIFSNRTDFPSETHSPPRRGLRLVTLAHTPPPQKAQKRFSSRLEGLF